MIEMKKIKYVDFWRDFKPEEFILHEVLSDLYDIELSDEPDYVIFSVYGSEHLKYKNAIKIFYTGENLVPDFNVCDYAIGVDYIEYGDRYIRVPNYYADVYRQKFVDDCMHKHEVDDEILKEKTEFCSFVYSNNRADIIRTNLFEIMNSYKRVNSGGRYMNNIGQPEGVADKVQFQKKHKFAIACENSKHEGYTTEKLIEAFAANLIPIYWGDPLVGKIFNTKSFINVNDYKTLDDVLKKVVELDNDDSLYMEMLKQPVFLPERENEQNIENVNKRVQDFCKNIFEQKREDAYRRNMVFYGEIYQKKMLDRATEFDRYHQFNNSHFTKLFYPLYIIWGRICNRKRRRNV